MPAHGPNRTPSATPWRVNTRPGGDFAVQRFVGGRTVRWGIYADRQIADDTARTLNAQLSR